MDNEKTEEIALPDVNSTFSVPLLPQSNLIAEKVQTMILQASLLLKSNLIAEKDQTLTLPSDKLTIAP